ncbi:hypothetical protein D9613_011754 [Agrocybe pediades]|uniref:Uncharacterized protein n=1 Tax=Agrocybe pediades TaxID=84607 RepID=A0A8H4QL40_9AGAR|nr:hypothetical protein D9613_011754 [Agrocybe pediades]
MRSGMAEGSWWSRNKLQAACDSMVSRDIDKVTCATRQRDRRQPYCVEAEFELTWVLIASLVTQHSLLDRSGIKTLDSCRVIAATWAVQAGLYLPTEPGHGLDSTYNIETTATKTSDGYILHTPCEEAARLMPTSTPSFNIPKVALVMVCLIVDGEERGCCFFVVPICNEREIFDHVHLPPGSQPCARRIGHVKASPSSRSMVEREPPLNLSPISVELNSPCIGLFSDKNNVPTPIITFRTQQWPIAHATAVGMVMANWYPTAVRHAMEEVSDPSL